MGRDYSTALSGLKRKVLRTPLAEEENRLPFSTIFARNLLDLLPETPLHFGTLLWRNRCEKNA